jgi:mRNA-degrading endonuclease toxin of MazEF toxin-antitoxin module
VVLISPPDRCARAKAVNVLFCTSQRQSRLPYPYEVMLDTEDGLNWESFCDCSLLYAVPSDALTHHRGHVSLERRRAIRAKLRDLFRLASMD